MLVITVPAAELWDESKQEFIHTKEQTLQLEHSLVSLSKWESKWEKPFLDERKDKSFEEIIDYIRCMTITQNVDPLVYRFLSKENIREINDYIGASMTATTFPKENVVGCGEIVTSELIYYWMVSFGIPFECQKWHINRLLTLIRVCNIKNRPAKSMSTREIMSKNAALNEQRRRQLKTKG